MYKKIDVTPAEMLHLREQGLSNHDIAKALDISSNTVRKYIGSQGRHMEALAAFKDSPPSPENGKGNGGGACDSEI